MLKNDKGFSLVNVMIAAAIAGGLAVVIMRLTEMSSQASRKMLADQEVFSALNILTMILKEPRACQDTLSGASATSNFPNGDESKTNIYAYNRVGDTTFVKFQTSDVIGGAIRLTKIQVSDFESISGPQSGLARIYFQFDKIGVKGASGTTWKSLPMNVSINGGGLIQSCSVKPETIEVDQYYVKTGYGGCPGGDTVAGYARSAASCGGCASCSLSATQWVFPTAPVATCSYRLNSTSSWDGRTSCNVWRTCYAAKWTLCKVSSIPE